MYFLLIKWGSDAVVEIVPRTFLTSRENCLVIFCSTHPGNALSTVVLVRWATVDWSWLKKWNWCVRSDLKKKKLKCRWVMNGLPPKILTSEERVTIRVVSKQPFCLDCPTFQWNLKSKSLSTWNCMQYFVLWIPLLLANLLPVCVSAGHQQLAAAEVGAHEHGSISETAPRSRCEDCYFAVSFILSKLPEWLAYFFSTRKGIST